MRYRADSLKEIYKILKSFQTPLAVIDFISGEMGYEVMSAQVLGGDFYDEHKNAARIVALCWAGQSLLFSNISDDQIELTDIERSMSGNRGHQSSDRLRWLGKSEHSLKGISGVVAHLPAMAPSGKMLEAVHGISSMEILERMVERLERTGYVFTPIESRAVPEPYIAVFDRNEVHQSARNTEMWQIKLLYDVAKAYQLKLVIVSGFNPKSFDEDDIVHFAPQHRDLDLLCNIARYSVFFAGPVSGITTTAALFGCNLLILGSWHDREPLFKRMVTARGFSYLGCLHANNVLEFLDART